MNSDVLSFASLAPVFPELLLAVAAIALLMLGVTFRAREKSAAYTVAAVVLLLGVAAWVLLRPADGVIFNGGFISDDFARYMKVLILVGSAFALLLSISTAKQNGLDKFEYAVLVMLATLGMMVMVSANDLISLYVGLELQSLALYVVAAINRDNAKATEAGLKYFVLGALSSGMLLYGASLVYGFTGQTQLDEITRVIAMGDRSIGLIFGMVFLLAGIAFKISAVPFHMWTPDVYEGAPTPVTAFFASAPKVAAMALLVRVVTDSFEPLTRDWQQIIIFLSIASMVLAGFAAIGQNNLKRLLAYSSIGHVGFALVGLSSGTAVGVEGVAIYMAIYITMTVGLFACILSLRTETGTVETITELGGLAQSRPFAAAMIAILMFSLIGLPPLAGFFAKWHVFLAAIEANLFVLAVIGVLASAVSAYYYLRIVRTMYFDPPVHRFPALAPELTFVMAATGFLVVTYFVTVGSPLASLAHQGGWKPVLVINLGSSATTAGHRIEQVPTIGSTNAALIERAGQGETGPLWLVADRQEQGRGRNARNWSSPEGNLYASLLLTNPAPAANVAQLSFVLSLALREAVLAAAGMSESPLLALKWPNDLMAEGRKTAGLLLEGGQQGGVGFVVAGFGVNIVSHPDGTSHPATNLTAAGFAVDRDRLATALTEAVADRLMRWHRGAGFAGIRADWLKAAHGLGATLRVNTVAESFEGTFDTIDPTGRLVVITPTGNRLVSAGDVFVLGTAA